MSDDDAGTSRPDDVPKGVDKGVEKGDSGTSKPDDVEKDVKGKVLGEGGLFSW